MYDKCPTCEQNMKNFSDANEYGVSASGSYEESPSSPTTGKSGGGFDWNQAVSNVFGLFGQYGSIKEKEAQQGVSAAEAEAERARAAAERARAAERAATIKAYALPIAITGILAVGGIAAYFYFKRAKLN
jgi:hypothetical protein